MENKQPEYSREQPNGDAYLPRLEGWFGVSGDVDDFIYYGQISDTVSQR